MKIHAVTSFHTSQWETHAKRSVETFMRCWPADVVMECWTDGPEIPDTRRILEHEGEQRVAFTTLYEIPAHEAFMKEHGNKKRNPPPNDLGRFCHKVFATAEHAKDPVDWLVWIDADVFWKRPVDDAFFDAVFPDDKDLTFLGRDNWAFASEIGFVAYRMPICADLVIAHRDFWRAGLVELEPWWADAYTFDMMRRRFQASRGLRFNDLSSQLGPSMHVWPRTILGRYSSHKKGARKSDPHNSIQRNPRKA